MTPGPPYELTCPHCGGTKHIASIASGNTFGGKVWSDSKHEYPMLPSPSPIQKCPHCGGYYFYDDSSPRSIDAPIWASSRIETEPDEKEKERMRSVKKCQDEAWKNGFGDLSFEETDEAFSALYQQAEEERQTTLLFLWLFSYNDRFGGRKQGHPEDCPDETQQRFNFVAEELCERFKDNRILAAELHREMGDFEGCVDIAGEFLWVVNPDNPHLGDVARQIIEHAKAGDREVFVLSFRRD